MDKFLGLNVRPCLTNFYVAYGVFCYTKFSNKIGWSASFFKSLANIKYFSLCQYSFWIKFPINALGFYNFERMRNVCATRNDLQIIRNIVVFYAINMVYGKSIWKFTDKSLCYKPMNFFWCAIGVSAKAYALVTLNISRISKYFSNLCRSAAAFAGTHYAAKVRNRVKVFKPLDWLPYFHVLDHNTFAVQNG